MNAQLVLENVTVRLPNRLLFEEVNWTLYEGMRVALAGRNGSGKSTLLRIMAGRAESTEGKCTVVGGRKLRMGFLDQTLLENAVAELHEKGEASQSAVQFLLHRLSNRAHEVEEAEIEWEARKILGGLGFSKEWMDGPMARLSGGWLLRVFIAGALLEKPEVLLLDEPTNHLDLSSIQWLEEFIRDEYEGSLVLVTHDVALQKRTTDALAILHGSKFFFRTHQQDYLTFRESLGEETRILEKAIDGIQKKIDENMEFYTKFRAKANVAARAQSKLKAAEDLEAERRELKDRLQQVQGYSYNLHFSFRGGASGAKFPLSTKALSFRYSENSPWILKDINIDMKRGQTVAIIGDNGAGKTTLLNVLAGRLKPTTGEMMEGYGVQMGYFGQHQLDELSLDDTVIENLRGRASGVSLEQMRGWLGAFGFGGNDEINKKAKVLSGGEKARLAMLRILCTPINVCLLDEPTNHLDIETKELLKNAIRSFEGTSILVSHDREFVADIAERIIYLSSDHKLTDHIGNLESFFAKYPQYVRHLEGKAKASTAFVGEKKAAAPSATQKPQISFEERKKIKNAIRSLERKIEVAEKEIEKWGQEKDTAQQQGNFSRVAELDQTVHSKMAEWEKWSTEIEALRKQAPDVT